MKPICRFIFGVHFHQPIGNFESVIEEAYRRAYVPFIETLERHRSVRIVAHLSGSLLDVLDTRHPDFLERLRRLSERDQIEWLTGTYHSAILPAVPDADGRGQILEMSEAIERHFGRRPIGTWVTERIWSPTMAAMFAQLGIRYCVLDENHLRCAGVSNGTLSRGYFLTEDRGSPVAVLPILEQLRYCIPYASPEQTLELLEKQTEAAGGEALAVFADNVEKFGTCPGSHEHCYENGWLDRFFGLLEDNQERFPTVLGREALDQSRCQGPVYIPESSYVEMMEWALPPVKARRYRQARQALEERGLGRLVEPLLRGAPWRAFLGRYPEINRIQKKMLVVSRRIEESLAEHPGHQKLKLARQHLWRGQCGDAYWHGPGGGVYLGHLRHALHRELNAANRLVGEVEHKPAVWLNTQWTDYDADLHEECLIESDRWWLIVSPRRGGQLVEVNYKPRDLSLVDTMSRREETDHEGLSDPPMVDRHDRLFGIDQFFAPQTEFHDWQRGACEEIGDFVDQPFETKLTAGERFAKLVLLRHGRVLTQEGSQPLSVRKTINLKAGEDTFSIDYTLRNLSDRPLRALWGVEFNVNMLSGESPDRYVLIDGEPAHDPRPIAREAHERVLGIDLIDEWLNLKTGFGLSWPTRVWRQPIETISMAGGRLETRYQGTCLLALWPLELEPGGLRAFHIIVDCGLAPASGATAAGPRLGAETEPAGALCHSGT